MTETTDNKDKRPDEGTQTVSEAIDSFNSPEAVEERRRTKEEAAELADSIISSATKCEISDLQNNLLLSCLRTNISLYKDYADTIKKHPEYQKYLQFHKYKWNDFIIIPIFDKNKNELTIKTVKLEKDGDKSVITVDNSFNSRESEVHPYSRNSNVFSVMIHDESQKYGYSTISMNKFTWEISDVNPSEYQVDNKGVDWLLDTIWEKSWKQLTDCSEQAQQSIRSIVSEEDELKQEAHNFSDEKRKLAENLTSWNISWAISSFINIIKLYFWRKEKWRIIGLWNGINYEWDERDFEYLQSSIETVLDPEQRSKLTYMISKIKDKYMKTELEWKGVENPSAFDLMLQQCKPGQIMLTNALDADWDSWSFKYATQAVSWSRWCHALIISDVIKDDKWVITDAKIIQSTLKSWVHETSLKEYVKSSYSASDFLLADTPEWKANDVIDGAKSKIWQKYDRVSIVTDAVLWMDADKIFKTDKWNILDVAKSNLLWNNKAYCSELVFDAMGNAGLTMPEPHMSPADILTTDQITPQYACYCDKF